MSDGFDTLEPSDAATQTRIQDDMLEVRRLAGVRDAAKQEYEDAEAEFKRARRALYERMLDEKVESMRVDGNLFVRKEQTWYSTVQDRAAFVAWAEKHRPGLLKTQEEKAKLNELVRERLANGEELPPGVGAYPEDPVVTVRK